MTGQTEAVDGAEFGVLGSDAESEEFNRYHLLIVVWIKKEGQAFLRDSSRVRGRG